LRVLRRDRAGEDLLGENQQLNAARKPRGRSDALSGSPLSSASRSRFSPSMATRPPLKRACPAKAARSCLTRALARLVTRIACVVI
jgi:hypothetical protein